MSLLSLFTCTHPSIGWPHKAAEGGYVQTCTTCGKELPAQVDLTPNPRFDIPRASPKPVAGKRRAQKVKSIRSTAS